MVKKKEEQEEEEKNQGREVRREFDWRMGINKELGRTKASVAKIKVHFACV